MREQVSSQTTFGIVMRRCFMTAESVARHLPDKQPVKPRKEHQDSLASMKNHNQPTVRAFLLAALSCTGAYAQSLSTAQIKQIEEIAQNIARQHNGSASSMLDDTTVSTRAVALARNVRFEYVLRVKKGLPPEKIKEFSDETRREIVPKSCAMNAKNPAFDRGLTYTFAYSSTYGEKLSEFTVDKTVCATYK